MIKRAAGYFSDFAIFLLIMTTALLTGCGAPTEDSAPEAFAAEIETEAWNAMTSRGPQPESPKPR